MRLVNKDTDDDKVVKRWRGHRDVILKVCKAKYEGARLPACVLTGIRDLNLPKLKAHKEQATVSHLELDDFIIKRPCEPESEAFFSEFDFDQRDVPVHAPELAAEAPVAAAEELAAPAKFRQTSSGRVESAMTNRLEMASGRLRRSAL